MSTLDDAAAKVAEVAQEVGQMDVGDQAAAFLSEIALALTALSQALSVAAKAFAASISEQAAQAEAPSDAGAGEAPPATEGA